MLSVLAMDMSSVVMNKKKSIGSSTMIVCQQFPISQEFPHEQNKMPSIYWDELFFGHFLLFIINPGERFKTI